jgi:pilus assembly protein CpaD
MSKDRTSLRALITVLALSVVATTASGCFPLFKKPTESWSEQNAFPIKVDPDTASMAVPVGGLATGISADSTRDVRAFIAVYKARGHGPLTIARPVGSSNEKPAGHAASDILHIATELGVSPADIMPQTYKPAEGAVDAPITLSFTSFVASTRACGDWSHNMGESARNTEMPNLGCATQNNIAAMVEDPHDLIGPRDMQAADAERRAAIFDKYRKGETTITTRQADERGNVSKTESGGQ